VWCRLKRLILVGKNSQSREELVESERAGRTGRYEKRKERKGKSEDDEFI